MQTHTTHVKNLYLLVGKKTNVSNRIKERTPQRSSKEHKQTNKQTAHHRSRDKAISTLYY